jgi:hypothetical protein
MAREMRKAVRLVRAGVLRNSFFTYDITFPFTAAPPSTLTDTVRIQSDAHFICVMSMYDSQDTAQIQNTVLGGALVQMQDTAGQRLLSTNPVPINTIFGTGQRPFVWPYTHLFRANGGILINIQNFAALVGGNQRYRLVFGGYKIPVGSVNLEG